MNSFLSSLSILIPTYNDEQTIGAVIEEALGVGSEIAQKYEVIVVNDGSGDNTSKILTNTSKKNAFVSVITHVKNLGYGATIKELYCAGQYDWLATLPGDGQIEASEITKLAAFSSASDMIIGSRNNRQDNQKRIFQSAMYNFLLRVLFGISVIDVNSVRLMKREILKYTTLRAQSAFVDAELFIKATTNGFRVTEVPIGHLPSRKKGNGGSWGTIWPTIKELILYKLNQLSNSPI